MDKLMDKLMDTRAKDEIGAYRGNSPYFSELVDDT
jgi:hypothetical protein